MKNTVFKRRSINLDKNSYQRGILLAQEQALSLFALLKAFEHYQTIIRKQDGGRSCLQQQINAD
jgi:hypothetical protein